MEKYEYKKGIRETIHEIWNYKQIHKRKTPALILKFSRVFKLTKINLHNGKMRITDTVKERCDQIMGGENLKIIQKLNLYRKNGRIWCGKIGKKKQFQYI